MSRVRIVCLSDTHGHHAEIQIPEGDVLVHAGDLTRHGDLGSLAELAGWLHLQRHELKLVVAGNHDFCFATDPAECRRRLAPAVYLQDEAVAFGELTFYGSPWQPWFHDWAFNLPRGAPLRAKWDRIPEQTDVLVTHGPPFGIGDRTVGGERVGCRDLLAAVERVRPRLHLFGHIHEGYGIYHRDPTTFVNSSICGHSFRPEHEALCLDLETRNGHVRPRPVAFPGSSRTLGPDR